MLALTLCKCCSVSALSCPAGACGLLFHSLHCAPLFYILLPPRTASFICVIQLIVSPRPDLPTTVLMLQLLLVSTVFCLWPHPLSLGPPLRRRPPGRRHAFCSVLVSVSLSGIAAHRVTAACFLMSCFDVDTPYKMHKWQSSKSYKLCSRRRARRISPSTWAATSPICPK